MSLLSRLEAMATIIGEDVGSLESTRARKPVDVAAIENVDVMAPLIGMFDSPAVWSSGRVLLHQQTNTFENGIWLYPGDGTPMYRSPADLTYKVGQTIFVRSGAKYGGNLFVSTKNSVEGEDRFFKPIAGGRGVHVGPEPPTDTSLLWIDDNEGWEELLTEDEFALEIANYVTQAQHEQDLANVGGGDGGDWSAALDAHKTSGDHDARYFGGVAIPSFLGPIDYQVVPTAAQGRLFTIANPGRYLAIVSGSGYNPNQQGFAALRAYVDGILVASTRVFVNQTQTHEIFPTIFGEIVLSAGQHRLFLTTWEESITNDGDSFSAAFIKIGQS